MQPTRVKLVVILLDSDVHVSIQAAIRVYLCATVVPPHKAACVNPNTRSASAWPREARVFPGIHDAEQRGQAGAAGRTLIRRGSVVSDSLQHDSRSPGRKERGSGDRVRVGGERRGAAVTRRDTPHTRLTTSPTASSFRAGSASRRSPDTDEDESQGKIYRHHLLQTKAKPLGRDEEGGVGVGNTVGRHMWWWCCVRPRLRQPTCSR
jgi:hypothetical protein